MKVVGIDIAEEPSFNLQRILPVWWVSRVWVIHADEPATAEHRTDPKPAPYDDRKRTSTRYATSAARLRASLKTAGILKPPGNAFKVSKPETRPGTMPATSIVSTPVR